ncbi:polymer-forming cytoskeletal protein [Halostella sp. JP-L12]|uniref:bactofilin family protein n=1 Tax=Halostella TaxID=1843185 RepID=UPI000EF832BB|nr:MULTISPECIES: polymer-forming cytoskeletal protein [Halostella]NHN46088.1 polymer-forming cytoskeletal protein [Halostella sp. JP-L12]
MNDERRSRYLAVALALIAVLATVPGIVAAQETRTGGTVVVGEGETVDGDLTASGGNVIVRGTVTGDLSAFSGNVIIEGEVGGDVSAFAGNVRIAGDVGGDVSAFGGTVVVEENASVGGQLAAAAGTVTIDGTVGSAEVAADTVALGSTAVVEGDLRYDGNLTAAEGSAVRGETVRDDDISPGPQVPNFEWAGTVFGFLVNLLLGAILLFVLPTFSTRLGEYGVDNPLRAGGIGVLALVAAPVLFLLFAITIVGIPIALAWLFLFLLLAWIGSVYGAFLVGVVLLSAADVRNRWLALVLGLVVVAVATQAPYVGGLIGLLVFLLGLGSLFGLVAGDYRRRRGRPGARASSAVSEPP